MKIFFKTIISYIKTVFNHISTTFAPLAVNSFFEDIGLKYKWSLYERIGGKQAK